MEVAASSTTCPCMQDGSIVTTGKNLVCTSGQERVVWESGPAPAPPARERLSPVKLVQDTRTNCWIPTYLIYDSIESSSFLNFYQEKFKSFLSFLPALLIILDSHLKIITIGDVLAFLREVRKQ